MYSDYLDTDQVYREFGESCLSLCLRALLTNKIGGGGLLRFHHSLINYHQKRSSKL